MIKTIYKKLKRGLWTFKQPLAARPKSLNNPVSDLFYGVNQANGKHILIYMILEASILRYPQKEKLMQK